MKSYEQLSRRELMALVKALDASRTTRVQQLNSQQKIARSALADSEERLRAILDTAVEGIITIDERGCIESMNPAAERTFGYKAREVIGKNVSLLMPSPYREEHDQYLANYQRTGKARIIGIGREVSARRKDGSVFPIDLSVSEVRLAERRLFTGFVRDITERKRLEREILETSDREQRRIGQDLHDGLCQQLAGIEMMSQVLKQTLAPKSKAAAAAADEIARHVRDAISQTRQLARGLSPVTLESEGLMSALHELATNTESLFQISCRFQCDPPVLVADLAVATQLFRIAQEAVSNGIKHGRASQIVIQLKSRRGTITLTIRDNGTGFTQAPPKGRGMGLRIMQSRAGMVGGTLAVENQPGAGVRVVVALPARLAQNPQGHGRKKENTKAIPAHPHR